MKGQRVVRQRRWNKRRPVASVVIPCFNYGAYVRDAIDSALSQTLRDVEVVVVDDGSTDPDTVAVVRSLKADRTKVVRQKNRGLPSARNRGIDESRGKYICCLDADDMIDPTYLEKAVSLLECRPDIGFAYTWIRRFGLRTGVWENHPYSFPELIHNNLANCSAVFRREAWKKSGGYWKEVSGYEDWEFWIRLGAHGYPGARIPEALHLYRKHGPSMIDDAVQRHASLVQSIRTRHRRLYHDPQAAEEIQERFLDREVDLPFLNLSRPEQYQRDQEGAALLITGGMGNGLLDELLASRSKIPASPSARGVCWLTTLSSKECEVAGASPSAALAYYLPDFLPSRWWVDFALNMVWTRQPSELWLSRSPLAVPLAGRIRTGAFRPRVVLCAADERDIEWIEGWDSGDFDEIVVSSGTPAERWGKAGLAGKPIRVIASAPLDEVASREPS